MLTKVSSLKNVWQTVIGLEIHAQINSKTKLFSVAKNNFLSPPNSNVAYFDMSTPGTLPIINSKCIELAILAASVLKCEINYCSEFDRKHYFYADMPAGYQITQHRQPIGRNGKVKFLWNSIENSNSHKDVKISEVKIIQIHLEQDSGKSLHDYQHNVSMIDLNRAGVGLLEVVTDCQFQSAFEAVGFVKELRDLFCDCGICNGHMEQGELRVDANISVKLADSEILGERSEVKNINSLRGVLKAIEFESSRHIKLLESGQCVINETRFYDPLSETTLSMRDKENIQDYRYFSEPNLPPLRLKKVCERYSDRCVQSSICVPCVQNKLENFSYPFDKRQLLVTKFCMSLYQANTILAEPGLYDWLISVANFVPYFLNSEMEMSWYRRLGSFTVTTFLGELRSRSLSVASCHIDTQKIAGLVTLSNSDAINPIKIIEVLKILIDHPEKSPGTIVKENQWEQLNDPREIEKIVRNFIQSNPKALHDYKAGNKRVSRFFKKTIKSQYNDIINTKMLFDIIDRILEENVV